MRRALTILLTVATMAQAMPRIAWAQPSEAQKQADAYKRMGDQAIDALRSIEALDYYDRAYAITHDPALLYNKGRAHEILGDFPAALEDLEEFSKRASPELLAKVGTTQLNDLLADIRKRVSTLILSANVEGAEIRVNDRVIAKTEPGQLVKRINSGRQRIRVTKEGYFPYEKELTFDGGRVTQVEVTLTSSVSNAVLKITSPVTGAAVSVDGKAVGVVPAEAFLQPGSHSIALQRRGYDPATTNVVLAAGERKNVDVPMAATDTLTGKWWFWTAIGVAVAAGTVATVIALTTEREADRGTIDPGRVKAELRF